MDKGIPQIYDKACLDLTDEPFMEWIMGAQSDFEVGQLCWTVAAYVKRRKWYLDEAEYNPYKEEDSTWYARVFSGSFPASRSQHVMKYFDLENDERLITTNSKVRPVILLRSSTDDWWNPPIAGRHQATWLCLPLFSYKSRHNQEYVINDQSLENPDNFYVPPIYGKAPGVDDESAARFQAVQMVASEQLKPMKQLCTKGETTMKRPFKLSRPGLRILMYHFWVSSHLFESLEEIETDYQLFKSEIKEMISAAQ